MGKLWRRMPAENSSKFPFDGTVVSDKLLTRCNGDGQRTLNARLAQGESTTLTR